MAVLRKTTSVVFAAGVAAGMSSDAQATESCGRISATTSANTAVAQFQQGTTLPSAFQLTFSIPTNQAATLVLSSTVGTAGQNASKNTGGYNSANSVSFVQASLGPGQSAKHVIAWILFGLNKNPMQTGSLATYFATKQTGFEGSIYQGTYSGAAAADPSGNGCNVTIQSSFSINADADPKKPPSEAKPGDSSGGSSSDQVHQPTMYISQNGDKITVAYVTAISPSNEITDASAFTAGPGWDGLSTSADGKFMFFVSPDGQGHARFVGDDGVVQEMSFMPVSGKFVGADGTHVLLTNEDHSWTLAKIDDGKLAVVGQPNREPISAMTSEGEKLFTPYAVGTAYKKTTMAAKAEDGSFAIITLADAPDAKPQVAAYAPPVPGYDLADVPVIDQKDGSVYAAYVKSPPPGKEREANGQETEIVVQALNAAEAENGKPVFVLDKDGQPTKQVVLLTDNPKPGEPVLLSPISEVSMKLLGKDITLTSSEPGVLKVSAENPESGAVQSASVHSTAGNLMAIGESGAVLDAAPKGSRPINHFLQVFTPAAAAPR